MTIKVKAISQIEAVWETGLEPRRAFRLLCSQLPDDTVGLTWEDGWTVLRTKGGKQQRFRGAAVQGCGADDEFVQHLAKQLVEGE